MKIKHTLTLFCVTLTLVFLLVSCADTQGNGGDTTEKQFSNVSAESCGDIMLELNCFISVWNTANSGTGASDSTNVVLPLVEGGTYDFYVNWGDDSDVEKIEAYNAPKVTHNYDESGTYTIHIAGIIKGWRFFVSETNDFGGGVNDFRDAVKLLDVSQWGSLSLGNTDGGQFYGAENFNPTATDAPDISETTSLHSAFSGASNFNADISDWDVSKVTDMSRMFRYANKFNNNGKGLDWDDKTSKVTNMDGMFNFASNFNADISDWDVSKVTDMSRMFRYANKFNNNGKGLDWDDKTSNVTDMRLMFNDASVFNQDISDWDVSKVTNMSYMFNRASSFNNNGKPFDWDDKTSNVTDMNSMFFGAGVFNQDISAWDVGEVTSMKSMFWAASVFNQDICYWNVENVTQPASQGFANLSALENKNNPFEAECTARKSN